MPAEHLALRCAPLATVLRACAAALALSGPCLVKAQPAAPDDAAASQPRHHHHALDRSGRARVGKASFYARHFAGKPMADGAPMDPEDGNAASKTLPLGTTARVTNLENGRSAVVTIEDRGPHVPGRIIDLSPGTARRLGIGRDKGVAKVEVAPISVPQSPLQGDAAAAAEGR